MAWSKDKVDFTDNEFSLELNLLVSPVIITAVKIVTTCVE